MESSTLLPKANSEFTPENRPRAPKGKLIVQAPIFQGLLAVSFHGVYFKKNHLIVTSLDLSVWIFEDYHGNLRYPPHSYVYPKK